MIVLKKFQNASLKTYAIVYYDKENKCISDVWEDRFGNSDNFKAVLSYVATEIENRKAVKWLADLRNMEGSFDSSSEWIQKEIMPRVLKAGLMLEAVVLPKNIFSKLSVRDTVIKINKFELQQFDDIQKAENWLKETIVVNDKK
jgi:hypothetical protein